MGNSSKGGKKSFAQRAAKAEPAEARGDEFDFGKFRVTYKSCLESDNGAFCFTFAGAGKDAKIGERIQWFSTTGKASYVTEKSVKRLAMILSGVDDADAYAEFDGQGEFIDAMLHGELDTMAGYLAEHGDAKSEKAAAKQIAETEFVVRVTKGGEKDDGGHFKNANFAELDGDANEDEEDSEDDAPESEAKPRAGKKVSKRAPVEVEDEDDGNADEDEEDEAPESEEEPPRRSKKKAHRK